MGSGRITNLLWTAILCLSFVAITFGKEVFTQTLLYQSALTATAEISDAPRQHNTCKYVYSANGRPFAGEGHDCGSYPIGSSFTVYYWPNNPAISSNLPPGTKLQENIGISAAILMLIPLLSLIIPPKRNDD